VYQAGRPIRRTRQELQSVDFALDCKTQLNEDLRARIELWLAADEALGVPEPHRRRLLVQGGSFETPLPTALSALMIHGLYDSPQAMADLAQVIADHSINTLVSRMRGHSRPIPRSSNERFIGKNGSATLEQTLFWRRSWAARSFYWGTQRARCLSPGLLFAIRNKSLG
jgi:hypothetical protein